MSPCVSWWGWVGPGTGSGTLPYCPTTCPLPLQHCRVLLQHGVGGLRPESLVHTRCWHSTCPADSSPCSTHTPHTRCHTFEPPQHTCTTYKVPHMNHATPYHTHMCTTIKVACRHAPPPPSNLQSCFVKLRSNKGQSSHS